MKKRIIIELNECNGCMRALYLYLTNVLCFVLHKGKLKGDTFVEVWGESKTT